MMFNWIAGMVSHRTPIDLGAKSNTLCKCKGSLEQLQMSPLILVTMSFFPTSIDSSMTNSTLVLLFQEIRSHYKNILNLRMS